MPRQIFTQGELEDLATPFPDRIQKHIRQKKIDQAISLCGEMKASQIVLHDFFADSCTVLWSWVGEHLGEETMEEMFRYVFEQSARRQLFDLGGTSLGVSPRIGASLLAKGWRAHSCFGAGDDPGGFRITEDEEKFTFHLEPCGSGARLWRRGMYESSRGGKLSEKARPWTYNREGLPYYCMHCPFLNEILPYESYGTLMWPLDPFQGPEDVCKWYIYKNSNDIPDRFFEKFGLQKKKLPARRYKKRYFSDEELREMSRPTPDRIKEKIQANDLRGATSLCRGVRDEFLFLHDLYVFMLVATVTFISEKSGESPLGEALELQFEKCVKNQIVSKIESLPPREKVQFLATQIFGVDNCYRTGIPKGKFTISETESAIIFELNPCGSGGRLFRDGAYEPFTRLQKWREGAENSLTRISRKFMPDAVMEWALPIAGAYIMDRKPYGQGTTKKGYSWSFGKENLPYYCCQCGMLQEKVGKGCLEIHPPESKDAPCVWKIEKNK